MLKLIKGRSLPNQASIWLAAWPQQSTRQMPTELILDGKSENNIRKKHPPNPGTSTMNQNKLSWLGKMTNRELNGWSSNGVEHQMVLIIQQYHKSIVRYSFTNSSGVDTGILLNNFCVNWLFFKCLWSPWTMTVYLDEHKQGKMEKISQWSKIQW